MDILIKKYTYEDKPGYLFCFTYDADLIHDIKLLPGRARRYIKHWQGWWVSELYWMGASDFLKAHYGIEWTPPAVGRFAIRPPEIREPVEAQPRQFAPVAVYETSPWRGGRG